MRSLWPHKQRHQVIAPKNSFRIFFFKFYCARLISFTGSTFELETLPVVGTYHFLLNLLTFSFSETNKYFFIFPSDFSAVFFENVWDLFFHNEPPFLISDKSRPSLVRGWDLSFQTRSRNWTICINIQQFWVNISKNHNRPIRSNFWNLKCRYLPKY